MRPLPAGIHYVLSLYGDHRVLHSFPTRRSSDLCTTAPVSSVAGLVTLETVSPFTPGSVSRSEEHTSELQSRGHLVCRLLLEKKNKPASTLSARWSRS